MRWLVAAVAACIVFCLVSFGTLLPLTSATGTQYLFAWPGLLKLATAAATVTATLTGLYFLVIRRARRLGTENLDRARSGRWLAPLVALGAMAAGVLPAVPGAGEPFAVFGYFLYDLRWWWCAVAVVWAASRADAIVDGPIGRGIGAIQRWSPAARLLFLDGLLFVGVVLCATASTRYLRFDPGLHGDEPKYVRYAEGWYQGEGLNVSNRRFFRDLPLDGESHVFRNVATFFRSVGEETRALFRDLGAFAGNPMGFQWNRGQRLEGFVKGKRGDLYQIYLPGVSAFIFPGYYLDRHVLALAPTTVGEFPAEMVLSYMTLLFLYGFCAVALFRLLRHALGSELLGLVWAAVAMLSLPTAAFAFQVYPETVALLAIILVTTYLWFQADHAGWMRAAAAGFAAAGLAWLHPRFLLVSLILVAVGVVKTGSGRSRLAFIGAAAFGYFSIMAFAYRVTGSWLPTALWDAPGAESTLSLSAARITIFGYALHRTWGMAPHTPLLLAALPGLAVLARASLGRALFVLAVGLALAVPAAAHTLHAAGGTPGRLVVAIVPLFIWPVAVLVRRFWSEPAVRFATLVAVVVSLETAVSYNWHHTKTVGPLHTTGVSGWRPNLAFPWVSGGGWDESSANVALLVLLLVLTTAATIAAFVRARSSRVAPITPAAWVSVAATSVLILVSSAAATAFNREWVSRDYLIDDGRSRQDAAAALVDFDQCRICFATTKRAVDWRWLEPNGTERVNVETAVQSHTARVKVILDGPDGILRFARMRAEFGDGSASPWTGIVNERELAHNYKQAGQYSIVVWVQLRNGELRADRRSITISGSP